MGVTWTLAIELFSTFFIYIVAYMTVHYENRWTFYLLICLFTWIPETLDLVGYSGFGVGGTVCMLRYFPWFVFGIAFCDLENPIKGKRILDYVREWPWWAAILRDLFLFLIFISWGSYNGMDNCYN